MEAAGTPPQVSVLATRLKGEVSWAPFAGVDTVTAANAGNAHTDNARMNKLRAFTVKYLCKDISPLWPHR